VGISEISAVIAYRGELPRSPTDHDDDDDDDEDDWGKSIRSLAVFR
jgi:hypothetical protein